MVKDIAGAVSTITSDSWFPRLKYDKKFKVTSNINYNYNCIAWAMRLGDRWVDPALTAGHWWPLPITPMSGHYLELVKAFEAVKFSKCNNSNKEFWYDKVALYVHPHTGYWTHAARVLSPDEYHSKLGDGWDIHHGSGNVMHNPLNMKSTYGKEFQIMKRHKLLRFYSLWLTIIRTYQNFKDSIQGLI